ncbi:hypothetical protein Pcinc_001139 [Petrolisthes cinctipes]|uniref:Uncharacterized protein n=1 Tax=Petrolisthes cinctipes TaxID=88211 RepID=A0AAE1GLC2_PETCI|nr:hypothetical protein Pcinc_001139 [Petrolisthes cinctipes]
MSYMRFARCCVPLLTPLHTKDCLITLVVHLLELQSRHGCVILVLRTSKTDPLIYEVELIHANPQYAHIRHPDGKEDTVSIKHLAPSSDSVPSRKEHQRSLYGEHQLEIDCAPQSYPHEYDNLSKTARLPEAQDEPPALRRSSRVRHPPTRLEAS